MIAVLMLSFVATSTDAVETATVAAARVETATVAEPAQPIAVSEPYDEEIVVTGSRVESLLSDATVVVEVVNRKQIDESGAENLTDILDDVPGLQINHNLGRAGIQLQGLDPQYTLILVDGQRQGG